MTFLPVVGRELRVASRRRSAYWGRFAAGLIGYGLFAWAWLATDGTEQDHGMFTLQAVSWVIFVYAAVAGLLVTCDCLSEEKREGTLGLLFLTDLKGHDVVLGKLAATSMHILYGMLAVQPLLAIPFLVGGVGWAEMLRIALVSLNLLFCFLSIGLFVSALCRRDSLAMALSILIGLALVLGGPSIAQIRHFPFQVAAAASSPSVDCFLAFQSEYAKNAGMFWLNAAVTNLYAWIFLLLSCRLARRAWQDDSQGARRRWDEDSPLPARTERKRALLAANPYLWRVTRSWRRMTLVWLAMAATAVLLLAMMHWSGLSYSDAGPDLILLSTIGFVLKAWLAVEASRTFSEDRRSGGLELLLTTPLSEKEIVRGQWGGLARQFGPPTAALLVANLLLMAAESKRWPVEESPELFWIHVILGFFLVADMLALCWDGMWLGLINRKPNRAALMTVARILFLPLIAFALVIFVWVSLRGNKTSDDISELVLWCALALSTDLFFGLTSRHKLAIRFRNIVAEGVAGKKRTNPAPAAASVMAEAV